MTISKKQKLSKSKSKFSDDSHKTERKRKETSTKLRPTKKMANPENELIESNELLERSDSKLNDELVVKLELDIADERLTFASKTSDESDDSFPFKAQQKEADSSSETFATAFNAILGSKLKAYDRKDPILARNKTTHKKLESERLEDEARRALRAERKEEQDRHRVKNLLPKDSYKVRETLEYERGLKKVAQKGVVKLFNAVLVTQVSTSEDLNSEAGSAKDSDAVNDLRKLKFLDLVKAAGQE